MTSTLTADDTITFPCPACATSLAIPIELAGIVGPCPYCHTTIRAPYPAVPPAPPAAPAPIPQVVQQVPQAPVAPVAPPAPLPSYQAPVPQIPVPTPAGAPIEPVFPAAPAAPSYQESYVPEAPERLNPPVSTFRPEPRQLPVRSNSLDHVNKQIPDTRDPAVLHAPPVYPDQDKGKKLRRILVPVLFIFSTAAIIGGILYFLSRTPAPPARVANGPAPALKTKVILPEDTLPTKPPVPKVIETPVAPEAAPRSSASPTAGVSAMKTLEKFLAAQTLEERLPLIETRTASAELSQGLLAKPLPAALRIDTDFQETNALEKVTDIYYNVDFQGPNGSVNPQTVLVRTRGTADPKVVVDPLLDLYGGRLKKYASAPSDKPADFEVIISAGAFCYDENVPNRDKKLTLKLLARDNTKEITRAFFGKRSRIGEMLERDFSGISYGQAKACTVTLRWNTEEDKAKPYLEAIGMKSLNWNP